MVEAAPIDITTFEPLNLVFVGLNRHGKSTLAASMLV